MRRLTISLLAAAWLVMSPTTNAVEFSINDEGVSNIGSAVQSLAPRPENTIVFSPPLDKVSKSPAAIVQTSGADVFESPIDAPVMQGSSIPDSIGIQEIPQEFISEPEAISSPVTEGVEEVYPEPSATMGCTSGGPSCTGVDTSHVRWKAGDMFTADDCESCGGGCTCGDCGDSCTAELGCTTVGCSGGGLLGSCGSGGLFGSLSSGKSGCCDCDDSCCDSGCCKWFVNGWVSGGYTYNVEDPPTGFNTPLTFNDRDEEWMLNQAYLQFGRRVRECGCCWDWGGQVDLLYGTDYFFTQSTGLETRRDGSAHWNSFDPTDPRRRGTGESLYGLAMPQAYLEFYSPWFRGINVKLGHFYTTIGYESVMAPQNFFYSHAYTMQYGEPFTHTGVLTSFNLSDNLTGHFGITRGWDTWEDPNGTAGYLAGLSWTPSDVASLAFTIHTGREDDAGLNNRSMYSLVYTRQINNAVQYVLQHDFGSEANGEFDENFNPDSAKWYGINQYLFFDLNRNLTLGIRGEWFRDQDNARVLAIPQESLVDGGNYAQVSVGLNARIRDRLMFRPEVRYDWSDVVATGIAGQGMFNDFTEKDQVTIAGDMIFTF